MKLISRTAILAALSLIFTGCICAQTVPPDCKVLNDAEDKLLVTPYHSFHKRASEATHGKTDVSEGIFVNGIYYVQIQGAWRKSPLTVDQMRKQMAENRKDVRTMSCKFLREESVDGAAARVYQAHYETEDDKSDATLWISKSTGLILKDELDVDFGEAMGKSHMSIRYEYANVSAPAVH